MKWIKTVLVLSLLSTLSLGLAQQPAAVGVTSQYFVNTENNNQPADFVAFVRINYIAPGGGIPLHWHPGPFTLLVLEGEITFIEKGVEKVYKVGDSWTDGVGLERAHEIWNRGNTMVKYLVMGLVPKGVPAQTFVVK